MKYWWKITTHVDEKKTYRHQKIIVEKYCCVAVFNFVVETIIIPVQLFMEQM